MSAIQSLARKGVIKPPPFVVGGTQYETIMGSFAYGVSGDDSDRDVYGFCMPPRDVVFPHTAGHVHGFDTQVQGFDQWQEHHVKAPDEMAGHGRTYDFAIFNIVKYFRLTMDNNPNMIDSLFTPQRCVIHTTKIGNMVREQRHLFLSKKAWHTFKGYSYSQLHKMKIKAPDEGSKRAESIAKYGYDVKFAYHVVRLLDEVEQILSLGDIDLERDRERLKAIRRGEWTLTQVEEFFIGQERALQSLYDKSTIPHRPREKEIKQLLLNCLEEFYGNLSTVMAIPDKHTQALQQIKGIISGLDIL